MEIIRTSFKFENGIISTGDSVIGYPDIHHIHNEVKRMMGPVIVSEKLSGKIELEFLDEEIKMNYINIEPFVCVPQLMESVDESYRFSTFDTSKLTFPHENK